MQRTEQHGHGSVEAAVSTMMVGVLREYTGRGPTKARTTYTDNLVVCVMADTLTTSERTLVDSGRRELVLQNREAFQHAMRESLTSEVERLTERKVFAFLSANNIDPDIGVEVLLLEPENHEPHVEAAQDCDGPS